MLPNLGCAREVLDHSKAILHGTYGMRISSVMFLLAAVLSEIGAVAHEVLGSPIVLAPLAASNLPSDVIWLHHLSWLVGTRAPYPWAIIIVLGVGGLATYSKAAD